MSILIDHDARVIVQGITGREGTFHTQQMLEYGTRIVAGVTPGKGGQTVFGVPVYDDMMRAVGETSANTSVIYVPAPYAMDAILEAADAGIAIIICITEGIPVWDMLQVASYLEGRPVRLIGPNCPGIITPGVAKVGIMPGSIHMPGTVGVVARSGTLMYEVVLGLTRAGLGQSTCVGIGGDPIQGTSFVDVLKLYDQDPQTEAIALIGEIGGSAEEQAAEHIAAHVHKPVAVFIAGRAAPPERRMGHAGAIISGGRGRAEIKIAALREAGALIADRPEQVSELLIEVRK